MFDSTNVYSSEIKVTLAPDENNGYTLTYTPSAAWLEDSARAYPVTIDPYITSSGGIWTISSGREQYPTTTYGGVRPVIGKTVFEGITYDSCAYFKSNGITIPL